MNSIISGYSSNRRRGKIAQRFASGHLPGRVRRVVAGMARPKFATTPGLPCEAGRGRVETRTGQAVAGLPRPLCDSGNGGTLPDLGINPSAVGDAPSMIVARNRPTGKAGAEDARIAPTGRNGQAVQP